MQPDQPKRCPATYPRPANTPPNTRIVHCHLEAGHPGEHEEEGTEVTWLPEEPAPVPLRDLALDFQERERAAYQRGLTEGRGNAYARGVDRGFAVAVEALRDDARYEQWWSALPQDHPDYGYWSQHPRRQFADYLEVVGPWEPAEQPEPATLDPNERCACGHPRAWHDVQTTIGVFPCAGDIASCACRLFAGAEGDQPRPPADTSWIRTTEGGDR